MREMLIHRTVEVELRQVITLQEESIIGWSMAGYLKECESLRSVSESLIAGSSSHLATNLRQLARVTAVKEFTKQERTGHFFLPVSPVELENLVTLKSHLLRLRDGVPQSESLVAVLRPMATNGAGPTQRLHDLLEEIGMRLALESTVSDSKQLLQYAKARPAYVILSTRKFQGIAQHRPARRQLRAILDAVRKMDCRPIADGISSDDDAPIMRELGFLLAIRHLDIEGSSVLAVSDNRPCSADEVATDTVQSTLEEIAKVTARIRASWTDRSSQSSR